MQKANQNNSEKDNAIEKALKILECFMPNNNELSNQELSQRLGYHRATTSRTVRVLAENGYLYQNKLSKKYSLGNKIIQLNNAIQNSLKSNIAAIAHPYLLQLRDLTGLNVTLDMISGDSVVLVTSLTGNGPMILNFPVGTTIPWNTSSGMKAILAYADDAMQGIFFRQPLLKLNEYSITDIDEYKKALAEIREKGYAYTEGEPSEDICVLSMPVFDYNKKPVAAVSIAGIKSDVDQENSFLLEALSNTTKAVSENVSFR